MIIALTGLGLAAAAGLNAFLPTLIVALLAKFTTVIELPESLEWFASWPVIAGLAVLLIIEFFLDKIAGVDNVNDLFQGVFRLAAGALLFVVVALSYPDSTFWPEAPAIAAAIGALMAFAIHLAKATSRPAVNASTGGTGAPLASAAEDGVSFALAFVAIFAPYLVVLVIAGIVFGFYRILTSGHRRRLVRNARALQEREARESRRQKLSNNSESAKDLRKKARAFFSNK